MIRVSDPPNWILTTVFGAILGALFTDYKSIVLYPFRRLRKTQYVGVWDEYHWTWKDGKKLLCHARFDIRRGLLTPYSVDFRHVNSPDFDSEKARTTALQYKGTLRLEEGHVVIDLHATTHLESVSYRFPKWIPSASDFVVGIWMSFDHTGAPAAGGAILTRNELSASEVTHSIHERLDSLEGLLRVTGKAPGRTHANAPEKP